MKISARVAGGALVQHVLAALLPAYRLLVQPRAEWDAGHLGVGALQVDGCRGRRRQEREMFQNTPSRGRQADPGEILTLLPYELAEFGHITSPGLYVGWR